MVKDSSKFISVLNSSLRKIISVLSSHFFFFNLVILKLETNYNSIYLECTDTDRYDGQRLDIHNKKFKPFFFFLLNLESMNVSLA